MQRFTLPRDLYHGKGALEALKSFEGKKAIICVGGGSMKRFGFLDKAEAYLKEAGMEVELPDAMVENQLDGLINELRGHLQAQGVSLEQYLEMGNTTMEQLRDHAREQAAAAARYELAMTEIARREGIDITEADVDAKYAELSKQDGLSVELLRQQLPPLRLRHDLKLAAAQAVVVDSAKRK